MAIALALALSLHVLTATFWAGSAFVVVRTGGAGAERLLLPQLGASVVTILSGGYVWSTLHGHAFGPSERVLAAGALCAVAAALVLAALGGPAVFALRREPSAEGARARLRWAERIAAGLLALTVIAMATARFA